MTTKLERLSPKAKKEVRDCLECGARAMHVAWESRVIEYGAENAIPIHTRAPVWSCGECGFAYTDGVGQAIEHECICRHFCLLTPREVRGIRRKRKLSEAELAWLTRFEIDAIRRWERGAWMQDASTDRFLRLIGDDPQVVTSLRKIAERVAQ